MTRWMSVDIQFLDEQRQVRGWSWRDLARAARLDEGTLAAIGRTGQATPRSFRRLADAFASQEPLPGAEALRRPA